MVTRSFGVIAEDATDSAVLKTIIRRCLDSRVPVKHRSGKGCARVRAKAERWMRQLATEGVNEVIVLHDLDRNPVTGSLNDEGCLREALEECDPPDGIERLVCIPIEEIEAWFWADPAIVEKVGRGKGKASPSPHSIPSPKEKLMHLSRAANGKPRYSTMDNADLAATLDLELCAKRCPAFRRLLDFIRGTALSKGEPASA